MTIGYPKNKESIDGIIGELSVSINRNFRRAVQLKTELDAYSDQALTTAGYSAGEVTQLRTLVTALATLNNLYTGAATLGVAQDFRASLRPLWGVLGDF